MTGSRPLEDEWDDDTPDRPARLPGVVLPSFDPEPHVRVVPSGPPPAWPPDGPPVDLEPTRAERFRADPLGADIDETGGGLSAWIALPSLDEDDWRTEPSASAVLTRPPDMTGRNGRSGNADPTESQDPTSAGGVRAGSGTTGSAWSAGLTDHPEAVPEPTPPGAHPMPGPIDDRAPVPPDAGPVVPQALTEPARDELSKRTATAPLGTPRLPGSTNSAGPAAPPVEKARREFPRYVDGAVVPAREVPGEAPAEAMTIELAPQPVLADAIRQPEADAVEDAAQPVPHREVLDEQPAPARKTGPRSGSPHPAFSEATAWAMRILPIAADLLPVEIRDARRERRVRRLVVSALLVFVALLVGWYATAVIQKSAAERSLATAQDNARGLTTQQNKYSEAVKTQAQSKAITDQLRAVLARDLQWSTLISSLQTAAPAGVLVEGVTGALTSAAAPVTEGSDDTIGLITLTGTSTTKATLAAYVDSLAKVVGIANPFPTDALETDNTVEFTIRVEITKSAIGGRYTATPSASPTGGK